MGVSRLAGFAVVALGSFAWMSPLTAQISEERVEAAIDDAARGLGQMVAGGSPLTAPAAAMGGLGHFQVGVAGGLTRVEIEDPSREEGTVEFLGPVGTVQGAVGVWGGGPLGLGAVDILGRAGPVIAREDFTDNEMLYSVGVRVGIIGGGLTLPAVSATVSRSWVEGLAWGDPEGDEVSFSGDVATISARLDVSKSLLLVTPYAGVGIDRTSIEAEYRIPPSLSGGGEIAGSVDVSSVHQKAYAGVDFGFLLAHASVEVGVYDGGVFGVAGLRFGL